MVAASRDDIRKNHIDVASFRDFKEITHMPIDLRKIWIYIRQQALT